MPMHHGVWWLNTATTSLRKQQTRMHAQMKLSGRAMTYRCTSHVNKKIENGMTMKSSRWKMPPPLPLGTSEQATHGLIVRRPVPAVPRKTTDDDTGRPGGVSTPCDVLRLMDALRIPLDADTYSDLIQECTDARDAMQGSRVHAHIQQNHGTGSALPILADRLLLMYASCGRLGHARKLFDEMPARGAGSWATMIAASSHHGDHREALRLFVEMHEKGLGIRGGACFSNAVVAVLRSCARARDMHFGQQVHGLTLKWVGTAGCAEAHLGCILVQLYGMAGGGRVWRGELSGSGGTGRRGKRADQLDRALLVFREMARKGSRKDCRIRVIYWSILTACAWVGDEQGRGSGMQVHADAIKTGLDIDPYVGRGLVGMYGKCGRLGDAKRAFHGIDFSLRDAACWNVMLSSLLARSDCSPHEAIKFLYEMKAAQIEPRESLLYKARMAFGS